MWRMPVRKNSVLILKGSECLGQGILGPASRIRHCSVFEESRERRNEIGHQVSKMVVQRKRSGLGNDQIAAIGEGFRNLGRGDFR
jgi:hypothetical protein